MPADAGRPSRLFSVAFAAARLHSALGLKFHHIMKTPKLYHSARHPDPAANVAVVGNLTIVVHQIDRNEVLFVLNPNIQDFHHSAGTQDLEFERTDETQLQRLSPASPPVRVSASSSLYDVSLAEIGMESMPGVMGQLFYCVFDVTECPSASERDT